MKIRCFAFRISFISTRFSTRECKYPERGEWILPISLSISLPPFLPSFSSFQPDKRIIRFVKRNLRFFSRIGIQKLLSVSLSFLLLFLLFFETHLIPHTFFFCRFKNYFKLLIDNFYFEKWRILLRGKNINFNSSSLIKNYIDLFDGARVPLFDGITRKERKGDRFSSRKRFWETIFFFTVRSFSTFSLIQAVHGGTIKLFTEPFVPRYERPRSTTLKESHVHHVFISFLLNIHLLMKNHRAVVPRE